jgi:hypothetical protein
VSEVILVLSLLVPDAPIPVGASAPVAVDIRNVSERPVWVVGVVDGSEEAIRYPHYRPQISRDGEVVAEPPPPEDPLVSPLRSVDFRLLNPGESFDPTRGEQGSAYQALSTFVNFRPAVPSVYTYSLTFSTESASLEQWLGRFNQDAEREAVLERAAQVPRVTLTATASIKVR